MNTGNLAISVSRQGQYTDAERIKPEGLGMRSAYWARSIPTRWQLRPTHTLQSNFKHLLHRPRCRRRTSAHTRLYGRSGLTRFGPSAQCTSKTGRRRPSPSKPRTTSIPPTTGNRKFAGLRSRRGPSLPSFPSRDLLWLAVAGPEPQGLASAPRSTALPRQWECAPPVFKYPTGGKRGTSAAAQ